MERIEGKSLLEVFYFWVFTDSISLFVVVYVLVLRNFFYFRWILLVEKLYPPSEISLAEFSLASFP